MIMCSSLFGRHIEEGDHLPARNSSDVDVDVAACATTVPTSD